MTIHPTCVVQRLTVLRRVAVGLPLFLFSHLLWAQASPFETGANSLVTDFIAIATPIAILLVMVLGVVAATGRISWGWPIGVLIGIGIIFGAPQIVAWARAIFGV